MKEIVSYYQTLLNFGQELAPDKSICLDKQSIFKSKIEASFSILSAFEKKLTGEKLKEKQKEFRTYTNDFFQKSYFMNRAKTWPMGYPGDHIMLEKIYHAVPVSKKGIGLYLDNYFLNSTLARGVRERKTKLRELLLHEITQRKHNLRIMNIGCGSSREIFDIGRQINHFFPKMTFLDFDERATLYTKQLLFNAGINISDFTFKKFNALKLTNVAYTQKEFSSQDIIYSAGLFDYLKTKVLTKIITSLYELLKEGGVIIAPFKDADNYQALGYHWIIDWSYFYQRSIAEVQSILTASIPKTATISIQASASPAINFFIIQKPMG